MQHPNIGHRRFRFSHSLESYQSYWPMLVSATGHFEERLALPERGGQLCTPSAFPAMRLALVQIGGAIWLVSRGSAQTVASLLAHKPPVRGMEVPSVALLFSSRR